MTGARVGDPGRAAADPTARRNYRLAVANGVLFNVGESFIDSATVIALFVTRLTERNWLVGLAVSLLELGWYLPQILTIHFLEGRRRRLPIYAAAAVLRVLGLAAVTGAVFLLGDRQPGLTLGIFLGGYALFAFAGGFAAVSFYDVVGRTVPLTWHPRMWAQRLFYGGVLSAACGGLIARILTLPEFAQRFGILFAAATLFVGLGLIAFLRSHEPPVEVSPRALAMGAHLRENARLAWRDPAFRALFGNRVALAAAGMAAPFFVVYALRSLGLPSAVIGAFVSAKVGGFVLSNLVWQRVAQRRGQRELMRLVSLVAGAAPGAALAAAVAPAELRPALVGLAFVLTGAAVSGTNIGFQSLLLAIAPAARRPSYVGLMNSFIGPATALPALGGLLVDYTAPAAIFALAVLCAGLAWVLAGALPDEPAPEAVRPPGRDGEPG